MKSIESLFEIHSSSGDFALPEHECLYKEIVQKSAKYLQAHESMVAMGLLGALSCAAQGAYDVERPSGEKNLPVSLYLLTIADPSERKTSVEDYFFEVLRTFEQEKISNYNQGCTAYEIDLKVWNLERKLAEKYFGNKRLKEDHAAVDGCNESSLHELYKREPKPPVNPRFIYDDTTPEALLENMYRNRPLACLVTSEANSVLNGRALTAMHHLNNLWSRSGARVDRLSKPSFFLDKNARLTLALMTQRSVVDQFIETKGEKARGTGFLSRMLVCSPPRLSGTRSYSLDDEIKRPDEYEKYQYRILQLARQADELWCSKTGANTVTPKALKFNDYAKKKWREIAKQIEDMQRVDGLYYFATDHAGKIMENTTRVAALIHLLESDETEISEKTLETAHHIVMQLSASYMLYFCPKPEVIQKVDKLVQYVFKTRWMKDGVEYLDIDRRDILRNGPSDLRKASELDKAISILRKMGHIEETSSAPSCNAYLTVLPRIEPKIKNGYGFLVESLPPFQRLRDMSKHNANKMPTSFDPVKSRYFLFSEDKQEREQEERLFERISHISSWLNELRQNNQYDRREHLEQDRSNNILRQDLASKRTKNIDAWVREFTG